MFIIETAKNCIEEPQHYRFEHPRTIQKLIEEQTDRRPMTTTDEFCRRQQTEWKRMNYPILI